MKYPLDALGSVYPPIGRAGLVDVLVHDTDSWGVITHHLECDALPGAPWATSPVVKLSVNPETLLRSRLCPACTKLMKSEHPWVGLADAFRFLATDHPMSTILELDMATGKARRALEVPGAAPAALVEQVLTAHRERLRTLREEWMVSEEALESLELLSAVRSAPALRGSPTAHEQAGVGHSSAPLRLAQVLSKKHTGPSRDNRCTVLDTHAALKREGRLLVHVTRPGRGAAAALVRTDLLAGALKRFQRPESCSVMVLPRVLEHLARHPDLATTSQVKLAVLRDSDDEAVVETAVTLLREGAGTPSTALKCARQLV